MAKVKSVFVCGECGYESSGWLGKCPACGEWNTFFEQKLQSEPEQDKRGIGSSAKERSPRAVRIAEKINYAETERNAGDRIKTNIEEFDRVLGGGIVKDSLVLIGGDPGIGKSTLLLQIGGSLCGSGTVLYVSGEESVEQISMRGERLKVANEDMLVMAETDFEAIENYALEIKPSVLIIDSIQTVYMKSIDSAPGSMAQVRAVTASLMRIAKDGKIAVFIVGHVTKDGNIAGPKVLEHMVDTVLYFEGDNYLNYRILRGVKNRFGSTNEIGIFEMRQGGLYQVPNPSESMLSGRPMNEPGTAVISIVEGSRAMLVEVQALMCNTVYGMPRRTATGFDYGRMNIILAVLEKKLGLVTSDKDAYLNIIGGLRLTEPACDLGIAAALISSLRDKACDSLAAYIGEVGLTGEIRSVNQIEKRIGEVQRMGFEKVYIPASNYEVMQRSGELEKFGNIKIIALKRLNELIN